MSEDEHENWSEDESPEEAEHEDNESMEIQRLLSEMEVKAKKAIHYLLLEGFIEKTEISGVYKYTPEGLVLARQQYKQMKDEGLFDEY